MRRMIVAAVVLALAIGGSAAATASLGARTAAGSPARTPGSYRNPLTLRLPGGALAENCADPDVVRGTGADRHWYLYCTSDAIEAGETDAGGEPRQHLIPIYRSTDLVHWTYTGDAFDRPPEWVPDDAGLWAPEIQHRGNRWLLYFTAPDTDLPGGGSAIGVATSPSPRGPWTDTGTPVVAPTDNPTSAGDRRWTYDAEVVTEGGRSSIFFGSYFGGVFVRRLSSDGLSTSPSSERRIAIANRYEGTNIVRHGGWWYFLGSATNCCAGSLTGYGVFAARSRSLLGPYRDADGHSILEARVGGTPFLAQNGNRWVGPGHDSLLHDADGQDWLVYHAVDRTDPYVAGTTDYTKRPVLLDRVDWRSGWPVVRGGRGPSDSPQRAPASQAGQHDAPPPSETAPLAPGRPIAALSDDFDGAALSARWSWVRRPSPSSARTSGGSLRWATQEADLHPPAEPLASVLTEAAPRGDFVVEAKLRTTVPGTGDSYSYVQGGLLVYGDDEHYVKLASTAIFETRQTEFGLQDSAGVPDAPTYGNAVVGPVGSSWTWLRITRRGSGAETAYTSSTSVDGRTWRTGATWTTDLGREQRIGLVSMGGAGFTTVVDSIRVSALAPR